MSNRTIRILYVLNSADIYGASRCLVRLCANLDKTRFTPVVLLPESGPLIEMLRAAGVTEIIQAPVSIITRAAFKSWRLIPLLLGVPINAWKLRALVRKRRIDLVHTNVGIIISSALGARLAGVPHVWHIRDWYGEFRSLWTWYRRFILALSDAVVCVSRAIADQFGAASNVLVVHDGFTTEEFGLEQESARREFRQRYQIKPDAFVVGCVGRIKFGRKGQEFLVAATDILRKRSIMITALIVGAPSPGSESHLPRLEALVRGLGVAGQTIFTGELPDPRPAYAAIDVLALTSAQPEPFGGVVMEAMCMGKPVVATALGGSLDQVVEGETGLLVPPGDAEALATKITLLNQNPQLRKAMGIAAKKRIETQFSLHQMVAKIEEIYNRLLNK